MTHPRRRAPALAIACLVVLASTAFAQSPGPDPVLTMPTRDGAPGADGDRVDAPGEGMSAPATPLPPVSGQDAPEFLSARDAWLADDEAAALPALAQLAGAGNTAAQMLLALIDKSPALQGPWLSGQSRQVRMALMRAPGGLSGVSWMRLAAETDPRAALWVSMWHVDAPVSIILDFARAGELRAAREAIVTLSSRGRTGFGDIGVDPDFPAAPRRPVWSEWAEDPDLAADRAAEIAALHPGDPQRAGLGEALSPGALDDWLADAPEAHGLRALCASICPDAEVTCRAVGYGAFLSHDSFLSFGSPIAALVPPEAFAESPRGQAALLRHALLTVDARQRRILLADMRERSSCLATRMEGESARYRPGPRD